MSDASRKFGESATRYQTFRPDYPGTVYSTLLHHVTSGRDLAIDLGAGTGQATRALAMDFARVIAIEPDERLAREAPLPDNAEIRVLAAEDAAFDDAGVDAVIAATAFHWMDQTKICRNVTRWLKPGGVFFPFAFDAFDVDGAAKEIYDAEFAKWDAFRDRRLIENYDYEKPLREIGAFAKVIPFRREEVFALPAPLAAGLVSTFSYARAYAASTGDADGYFNDLKARLCALGETVSLIVPVIGAVGLKD